MRDGQSKTPWFYLSHGRVYGPLDVEALTECRYVHHLIDDDSLVWQPALAEWRPCSELVDLIVHLRPLPKGISREHVVPPPAPQFPNPQLRWVDAPDRSSGLSGDPTILLARAARVSKAMHSWPEALYGIRPRLFLPSARSACQLWIAPGFLAAVTLGVKRSIGLLSYPIIGTIGIPTGKEEGGLLFQIMAQQGVCYAIVDAWRRPSLDFIALETSDSYIGVTSLDYRAFEQPGENRKLIKRAAKAYDALGLRPELERRMLVFTEKLHNQSFSAWAAEIFGRPAP